MRQTLTREILTDHPCDLCGSQAFETLVQAPRSMTSDSRLTNLPLSKVACSQCGLGQNQTFLDEAALTRYYEEHYTLNLQSQQHEHIFLLEGQPLKRSEVIFQWMQSLLPPDYFETADVELLEVGCGAGELLKHFPAKHKSGLELSAQAVQWAKQQGLSVQQGSYREIQKTYDLIVSFGVIEHVPSPADFLCRLRQALKPGGLLLLGQPIQDGQSHDVFFIDHLHHFYLTHLHQYFAKTGFSEVQRSVGFGPITNFSLHLLQATEDTSPPTGEPIPWDLGYYLDQFQSLNGFLRDHPDHTLYVYGASERLKLYEANTDLPHYSYTLVDDFNPAAQRLSELRLETPACFLLTLNTAYQAKIAATLRGQYPEAVIYSVEQQQVL